MQTTKSLKRRYNGRVQRGVFVHSAVNTAAPGISIQPTPPPVNPQPLWNPLLHPPGWSVLHGLIKKKKKTCNDCVSDQRKGKAASLNPAEICDQQSQIVNLKKTKHQSV